MAIAVCGAHLQGMPLHGELEDAEFLGTQKTAAEYTMFALPGNIPKPALVRAEKGGSSFHVELYALSAEEFGKFISQIPAPLSIGKIRLENGSFRIFRRTNSAKNRQEYFRIWRLAKVFPQPLNCLSNETEFSLRPFKLTKREGLKRIPLLCANSANLSAFSKSSSKLWLVNTRCRNSDESGSKPLHSLAASCFNRPSIPKGEDSHPSAINS